MKRILLIAGSALAVQGALAADATPKAEAAPVVAPATSSDTAAQAAAKAEQARKELAELRTQMQDLSRKMAALSSELGEGGPRSYAYRYIGDPGRAMIGVVIGGDEKGVRLSAVTPDGPAARAGLREGDVITAIDGNAVGNSSEKARGLLANLKEGQDVTVAFARGDQKGVVKIAAERREAWNWPLLMNDDPDHPFLPKDFNERVRADAERAAREVEREYARNHEQMERQVERATREAMTQNEHTMVRLGMPWWGLNLAPLNADLGRYFGTDKGVLVIAADADSLPGIRAGDVITNIAGENVSRPEDALRALRDHEAGKDVAIKVLREHKTLALNMKAPTFNSIFNMRALPALPAPPVPAAPPARPAPASSAVPAPPAPAAPAPPAPPAPPDSQSAQASS